MILTDEQLGAILTFLVDSPYGAAQGIYKSHIKANARIRELEAEVEALRDGGKLTAKDIVEILAGNAEFLDKRHAEIDAAQVTIREHGRHFQWLALELGKTLESVAEQKARAEDAKAKLRELVEAAEEKDALEYSPEPGSPGSDERYNFQDTKIAARQRYQAALATARGGVNAKAI